MKRSEEKKRKWSQDLTKHFLEIYEQFPSLWDTRHADYKDRDQKKSALKQIVDAMIEFVPDFDIVSAKAKIRSIRNAYTLELHKVTKSKRNGALPSEVYTPTVSWFATADRFLRNVVQTRTNDCSFVLVESEHYDSDGVLDKLENSVLLPPKRFKKILSNDHLSKLSDAEGEAPQNVTNFDDDFDIFGRGVAGHLRNLPIRKALECQAFIQNYLIQQRINHLNKSAPDTSLSPFYPQSDSNESSVSYDYATPSVHVHEIDRPTTIKILDELDRPSDVG